MSTLGCCGHQASLGRGRAEKLKQPRVLCRRHGPRAEPEATTAATTAATGRAASTRGAKGLLPKVVGKAPPPPSACQGPFPRPGSPSISYKRLWRCSPRRDTAALGLVVKPQGSGFDSHRIRGREGPFGAHGWKETLTPAGVPGASLQCRFL